MGAAAQVGPADGAGPVEVVIDRQFRPAGLHDLVAVAALLADQFDLEGLPREFTLGLPLGHDPPLERLPALQDLDHALLDTCQILRMERLLDSEVVVEAVLDGRADAELRLGEQVLHGLCHDVCRGVAKHRQTFGVVRGDRLDLVPSAHDVRQILEFSVDPGDDHTSVPSE